MDWKIEVVFLGVADVDRAKAFYVDKAGFTLDHDVRVDDETRFVQLTPPGSACSIAFGTNVSQKDPGAERGLMVVVPDVEQAKRELAERGIETGEVDVQAWGRFVYFADPDGNTWAVQQLPDYTG